MKENELHKLKFDLIATLLKKISMILNVLLVFFNVKDVLVLNFFLNKLDADLIKVSLVGLVALSFSLLQQLIIGYKFGVDGDISIFFLALILPSTVAMIFNDVLQFRTLPLLLEIKNLKFTRVILNFEILTALIQAFIFFLVGLLWAFSLSIHRDIAFILFIQNSVLLSLAFFLAMLSGIVGVYQQSKGRFLFVNLTYLLPAPIVIFTIFFSTNISSISIAILFAGIIHLLVISFPDRKFFINLVKVNRLVLSKKTISKYAVTDLKFWLVSGSVLLVPIIDRFVLSFVNFDEFSYLNYGWAIALATVALSTRAPNHLISIKIFHSKNFNEILGYLIAIFMVTVCLSYLVYFLFDTISQVRELPLIKNIFKYAYFQLITVPFLSLTPIILRVLVYKSGIYLAFLYGLGSLILTCIFLVVVTFTPFLNSFGYQLHMIAIVIPIIIVYLMALKKIKELI